MNCSKINCINEARFDVILLLSCAKHVPYSVSSPVISVCNDHMDVEWSDVVTEEHFSKLQSLFVEKGFVAPLKEFCMLEIRPIKLIQNETSDN